MQLTEKFQDISPNNKIKEELLIQWLISLYKGPILRTYTNEEDFIKYKNQALVIINHTMLICKNKGFPEGHTIFSRLKSKFTNYLSSPAILKETNSIKIYLEKICYALNKLDSYIPYNIRNQIISSTLTECSAGAKNNLIGIYKKFDSSLYNIKHQFLQDLATEYIKKHNLCSKSMEIHLATKLLYEISLIYNLQVEGDIYTNFRDLDDLLEVNSDPQLKKVFEFRHYIESFLNTRTGVYSFINCIMQNKLGALPNPKYIDIENAALTISEIFNFNSGLIIEYSDKAPHNWDYKAEYQNTILIHIMKELYESGILKDEKLSCEKQEILETPMGWLLPEWIYEDNSTSYILKSCKTILDNKYFNGISFRGLAAEDFLHNYIKHYQSSFEENFVDILKNILKENGVKNFSINAPEASLLLASDQGIISQIISPISENLNNINYIYNHIKKTTSLHNLIKYISNSTQPNKQIIDFIADEIYTWRNEDGENLLHIAVKNNNSALMNFLIEEHPNLINQLDKLNESPLQKAYYHNNFEATDILLRSGSNIPNLMIESPNISISNNTLGFQSILSYIKNSIRESDITGFKNLSKHYPVFHIASQYGNKHDLKNLLRLDESLINKLDSLGQTALHYAVNSNNLQTSKFLLKIKPELLEISNNNHETPLYQATKNRSIDSIRLLIDHGAQINETFFQNKKTRRNIKLVRSIITEKFNNSVNNNDNERKNYIISNYHDLISNPSLNIANKKSWVQKSVDNKESKNYISFQK